MSLFYHFQHRGDPALIHVPHRLFFEGLETVVGTPNFLEPDLTLVIHPYLNFTFGNGVFYFAGDYCVLSWLEFVPKADLSSQLEFQLPDGEFINVELL